MPARSSINKVKQVNTLQQEIQYPERTGIPRYSLFTDGGCENNGFHNAYAAWAFILKSDDLEQNVQDSGYFCSLYGKPATNNKAEMLAVIKGLLLVENGSIVDIYTDSQVLISWIERWQTKIRKKHGMDRDLIQQFTEVAAGKTLNAIWIKGHNGHTENEWCDKQCELEMKRFRSDSLAAKSFY